MLYKEQFKQFVERLVPGYDEILRVEKESIQSILLIIFVQETFDLQLFDTI